MKTSAVATLACVGVFVIILDATIVSVALPHIAGDLGFPAGGLVWVVNAYPLAFAGALLLAGRLVANHGVRVMFLAGIGCFGAASLACGLAPTAGLLVVARAVQGLGGAVVLPATLTMITTTYVDPAARARALGLWSAVGAAGAAAGTVAGGVLTDLAGWRWVFLVNVPVAAAAVLAAVRFLPPTPERGRARLDLVGAVLATIGLVALVYGVQNTSVLTMAVGVVLLAVFLVHQGRWAAAPLVPLGLFTSGRLAAANAVMFLLGLGFFASPVVLSLYVQDALRYSPFLAGLAFLPAAAALFTGAQVAGRLTHRYGVRLVASGGALGAVAGFGWLAGLGQHTAYWPGIAVPQVLFGLGIGVAFTPITVAATAVAPENAGIAAGVLNTVRQVAAAIGLAVLTTVVTARGYDIAFVLAACSALLAACGAVFLLPGRVISGPPSAATVPACAPHTEC